MFVKGRLIGASNEVKRLEDEGKLKILLYGIPTEDSEAKKSSEQMLGLFEEMCPPGGENSVIIYTATIER
ncbi:hypothetical protein FRX31_034870 [Thalictrum thalictroides]|uniref:Uncharacterized protein n=1 Tax=Thalictrum thalictroides TaxID=46969 RepID=A0A7J6UTH3_THATH|nr:hypothetical protein FRX31_034870 [Thalictrum thalictroides]